MESAPSTTRVVVATLLAMCASIAADAVLVWMGTAITPSIAHYSHFRVLDYGSLTVVGVAAAGVAWAMVSRLVNSPRTFFFRLAIAATLALFLPDAWLLVRHAPPRAVAVLVCMHLAIAVITYWLLVLVAPLRERRVAATPPPPAPREPTEHSSAMVTGSSTNKVAWSLMLAAVVVEFVVGVVGMLYVPLDRPSGWIAHRGEALYLAHAVLGGALGIGALTLVLVVSRKTEAPRRERIGAIMGLSGVAVGAIGGLACYSHSFRLIGFAVMFVGIAVAFFGYVIPLAGDNDGMSQFRSTGSGATDGDRSISE